MRGGCWNNNSRNLRAAYRYWNHPEYRFDFLIGFRCVRDVERVLSSDARAGTAAIAVAAGVAFLRFRIARLA